MPLATMARACWRTGVHFPLLVLRVPFQPELPSGEASAAGQEAPEGKPPSPPWAPSLLKAVPQAPWACAYEWTALAAAPGALDGRQEASQSGFTVLGSRPSWETDRVPRGTGTVDIHAQALSGTHPTLYCSHCPDHWYLCQPCRVPTTVLHRAPAVGFHSTGGPSTFLTWPTVSQAWPPAPVRATWSCSWVEPGPHPTERHLFMHLTTLQAGVSLPVS